MKKTDTQKMKTLKNQIQCIETIQNKPRILLDPIHYNEYKNIFGEDFVKNPNRERLLFRKMELENEFLELFLKNSDTDTLRKFIVDSETDLEEKKRYLKYDRELLVDCIRMKHEFFNLSMVLNPIIRKRKGGVK